jgi:hypothetical protein
MDTEEKVMRKMKRPRANSLKDPVRIFTTVESGLKDKVFELAREDGRSVQEWLRVELKPLIEKRWAASRRKQAKDDEDELDPAERYDPPAAVRGTAIPPESVSEESA